MSVTAVNLLDCDVEPSDEELQKIMEEVAAVARVQSLKAEQIIREALKREMDLVFKTTANKMDNLL
jgi:hypothetical protein